MVLSTRYANICNLLLLSEMLKLKYKDEKQSLKRQGRLLDVASKNMEETELLRNGSVCLLWL